MILALSNIYSRDFRIESEYDGDLISVDAQRLYDSLRSTTGYSPDHPDLGYPGI